MPVDSITPSLIDAVITGELEIVAEYLRHGVDVDTQDSVGRSCLLHAASNGDKDIVMLLVGHRADVNATADDGETALIAALQNKRFDAAQMIVEAGADINMVSGDKQQTPLHWAFNMDLREGQPSRVLWLIDQGVDAQRVNADGQTVFDWARNWERKFPYAGELIGHMEERIKSRDPAVIKAREMHAAKEELCAAIHGGLETSISVKPLRLSAGPKKP